MFCNCVTYVDYVFLSGIRKYIVGLVIKLSSDQQTLQVIISYMDIVRSNYGQRPMYFIVVPILC